MRNGKIGCLVLCFLCYGYLVEAQQQQQTVGSSEELIQALSKATPGKIHIAPGSYSNWGVTIKASGTKESPLVISGDENGGTFFSGDGTDQSFFTIEGDYVRLENIVFKDIEFSRSIVRLMDSEGSAVSNSVFRDSRALRQWTYMVAVTGNGKDNEISYNHFENIRDAVLVQISIRGLRKESPYRAAGINEVPKKKGFDPENPIDFTRDIFPVGTKIHHNVFMDIPKIRWNNGGEAIQVGQYQNLAGEAMTMTEVFENRFIRYHGEGEVISNKSSGNSYYNNYFEDCGGSLVIRGGHDCKVYGNEFRGGLGGLRIYGTGHEIYDNLLEGTEQGILLGYGTGRGADLTFYTAVENCTIRNNRIINSKMHGIHLGQGQGVEWHHVSDRASIGKVQNIAPRGNAIFDNVIVGPLDKSIVIDNAPDNEVRDNELIRIQKIEDYK